MLLARVSEWLGSERHRSVCGCRRRQQTGDSSHAADDHNSQESAHKDSNHRLMLSRGPGPRRSTIGTTRRHDSGRFDRRFPPLFPPTPSRTWTSRRLAVAKHSGAVPWHCTSELPSRGEDVAPALLLTCPAGAHFVSRLPPVDHPPAPPAGSGPFQSPGCAPQVTQGAESRCTAICPGRALRDVRPWSAPLSYERRRDGCRVEGRGEWSPKGLTSRRLCPGECVHPNSVRIARTDNPWVRE